MKELGLVTHPDQRVPKPLHSSGLWKDLSSTCHMLLWARDGSNPKMESRGQATQGSRTDESEQSTLTSHPRGSSEVQDPGVPPLLPVSLLPTFLPPNALDTGPRML